MLFVGRRLETLRALPRDRLTLQVSLDSPTPERHDLHRGAGTWPKRGRVSSGAGAEGFRVRLAATVATEAEAQEFRLFLDRWQIREEDRVIRRFALRGFPTQGIALARADLAPGNYRHRRGCLLASVGAEDADLLAVTPGSFPLASVSPRRVAPLSVNAHMRIA